MDEIIYVQAHVDGWFTQSDDAVEFYTGEEDENQDIVTEWTEWIPKSMIRNLERYMDGDDDFIVIPEWKATEQKLDYDEHTED